MLTFVDEDKALPVFMGIDPGSETLGVSVLSIEPTTMTVKKATAMTFTGSRLPFMNPWITEVHGDRYARLQAHKQNLIDLFYEFTPVVIACESPFYNPRRPNAYGALVDTINMVRESVRLYDQWKSPYFIDPPTIKRAVYAKGNADKDAMKEAVLNLEELKNAWMLDPNVLDEHSIDAIAVAYCQLRMMRSD